MKSRFVFFLIVIALIFGGLGIPTQVSMAEPSATLPEYEVIHASGLETSSFTLYDVNDYGQIVGNLSRYNPVLRRNEYFGFLWDNGTVTYFGEFDGNSANAYAINEQGVVVGYDGDDAVRWINGQKEVISPNASAMNANNNGQIVGVHYTNNTYYAFLWENGNREYIGGEKTFPWGMNNLGDAVGYENHYPSPPTAVFFPAGGSQVDLPGAGYWSEAYSINNLGQIVGFAGVSSTYSHPALWINGNLNILPNWGSGGIAKDINDRGEIVGLLETPSGSVAVLWQPDGTLVNLNDVLPPGSTINLIQAVAISQNGQIAALGFNNGAIGIYLLVPAECPTGVCLEVSQGIQNRDNEMPLIAGRSTIVRAYLYDDPAELEPQIARMRAFNADTGVELPNSPIPAANNGYFVLADATGGDRMNMDHTPWFQVPREWRIGRVRFEVTVTYLDRDNNLVDKVGVETVDFKPAQDLHLMMIPLHLHEYGDPTQPVMTFDYAYALPMILDAYRYLPVANIQAHLGPTYTPGGHVHDGVTQEYNLNSELAQNALVAELYELAINANDPYPDIIYAGMVHPAISTDTTNGIANDINTRGIWVKMLLDEETNWWIKGGHVLAHEIGHARGLRHILCSGSEEGGDPDYPWLNPCRLAEVDPKGYFGLDVYYHFRSQLFPSVLTNDPDFAPSLTAFPLMGYQRYQWISPYETCKLLPGFGVPCSLTWNTGPSSPALPSLVDTPYQVAANALLADGLYLVARGALNTETGQASLDRLYQMQDTSDGGGGDPTLADTLANTPTQSWTVVQLDANGVVLLEQPILLDESSDAQGPEEAFLLKMPFATGVTQVEVRLDGNTVVVKAASANPPQVTLLAPNGGEMLAPGASIQWTASDADGNPLTFDLLYSHDDGLNWQAIALGVSSDSLTLESLQGLAGTLEGRFRVRANDGFFSTTDDSDAAFTVPDASPMLYLPGTETQVSFAPGSPVPLFAYAMDTEDGMLQDGSLSWSSDRDGDLGIGTELLLANLSPGKHTITVTAVDSAGNSAQASRVIFIGTMLYLPSIFR